MMLTLEQFLKQCDGAIGKIAWKNIRVYQPKREEAEEIKSEVKYRAIAWYRNYYEKFQNETPETITNFLMKHLDHKMQHYMKTVVRHWGQLTLDWDEDGKRIDVEDPRAKGLLERGENTWLTKALDMLPEEYQEVVCKRFGLRGYEARTIAQLGVGAEEWDRIRKRFQRAGRAVRDGRRIKCRKYSPRPKRKK
jgi:DNA-directed RNA polymerase specialized sigma24 family protein